MRGLQSRSGRGDEETNSQLIPRLETPIIHPVAQRYTTELPGCYHNCDLDDINSGLHSHNAYSRSIHILVFPSPVYKPKD
jgi:hypothetical protein